MAPYGRMCGRFSAGRLTQAQMREIIEGFLEGPVISDDSAPEATVGWNIKPTQQVHLALRTDGGILMSTARWWLVPHWHRGDVKDWKATTFNAKIETAHEKPSFRTYWKSGRCLIPATGYFEWTGARGKKQPWFIRPETNAQTFFFAGLSSTLGSGLKTCTILTRTASSGIADIHPRMPVILRHTQYQDWLAGSVEDDEVIETFGTDWTFERHTVHPFGLHDDGPDLIKPDGLNV